MSRFPYACDEAMARAFEARGHSVEVRRDRNNSRKVRIDGERWMSVHDAMQRIERELSA